jgi:hypothetical protein
MISVTERENYDLKRCKMQLKTFFHLNYFLFFFYYFKVFHYNFPLIIYAYSMYTHTFSDLYLMHLFLMEEKRDSLHKIVEMSKEKQSGKQVSHYESTLRLCMHDDDGNDEETKDESLKNLTSDSIHTATHH